MNSDSTQRTSGPKGSPETKTGASIAGPEALYGISVSSSGNDSKSWAPAAALVQATAALVPALTEIRVRRSEV
ncbi:MAG: hypothetical protein RIF32_13145 [Leptospirales bacterium]